MGRRWRPDPAREQPDPTFPRLREAGDEVPGGGGGVPARGERGGAVRGRGKTGGGEHAGRPGARWRSGGQEEGIQRRLAPVARRSSERRREAMGKYAAVWVLLELGEAPMTGLTRRRERR